MKDNQTEKTKKGDTLLLTIIAVATLLIAVVGVTFAYFTASIYGNDSASSVIVNTASLGEVTFTSNNTISLTNAIPGDSASLTFTVAATGNDFALQYVIGWTSVSNDYAPASDLVYTLSSNDSGAITVSNAVCPSSDVTIGTTGTLAAGGDSHSYTLTVEFLETNENQNSNQGKTFAAAISVTTTGGDTLYYNYSNSSGTTTQPTAGS